MLDKPQSEPTTAAQFNYLLQNDFSFFIQRVFRSVSPGDKYLHNWHIDAIAYQLERVIRGEITRLIITIPPRYMKSICASVALPAFILGKYPTKQIICVSYAQELAIKHSNDTRSIMDEPWYRVVFPHTRIEKNTEDEFTTTERGFRMATSVGGVLTGRGGNILIVDDPIKPQDAMSEVARRKSNEWLENTLFTRLNDKIAGAIIVVMQRLHQDDPVGILLEKGGWTHLNLPAVADALEQISVGDEKIHTRKPGDLLHPEREPAAAIERMKVELGSANFSAQYQQSPVSPEGNLIRWEWFKTYETHPPWEEDDMIFVSWDTASKSKDLSDYSAATVWHAKGETKELYLIDVVRAKLEFPALRARVISLHQRWRAERTVIEDKGSGTALIQEMRYDERLEHDRVRIYGMKPEGDKVMRMATILPMIEEGRVYVPLQASWLEAFRAEIMAFPRGRHDDQVDSLSQALKWYKERSRRMVTYGRTIGHY